MERSMPLSAMEIRYIAPFAALPREERTALSAAARLCVYRHGERLFQAGDTCADVVIMLDGYVRLFRANPGGPEVTMSLASHGSIVSVAALRGDTTHDAFAEAIGFVRTVEISAATLLALMSRSPNVFNEIAWGLIARTDGAYRDAITDVREQLRLRVLHTLRKLTRLTRPEGEDETVQPLAHRLSHAEIARIVGADRATVTRVLRLLSEEGLIRRERGHVTGVR